MTLAWAYGGGTQSVAIAVLIKQGRLPMPDLISMVNTGREVKASLDYLRDVVIPAGFNVHVIDKDEFATVDLYDSKGKTLIPAFTRQSGALGQMATFCSNEWKQRVMRRWLRRQRVEDCDVWIGISTNEMHRMKQSDVQWERNVYPLIELVPMNRAGCVALVEDYGWPSPPKSRCWCCPMQSTSEWKDLKATEPDSFQKAIELEQEIRQGDPDLYLHRLGLPLAEAVEQSELQPGLFDGCDSGYCMV